MVDRRDPPNFSNDLPESPSLDVDVIKHALEGLLAAADDPQRFADLRRQLLETYVNSLSSGRKRAMLRHQSEIDQLRALSGTPMIALARLVSDLESQLEVLDHLDLELKKNT